MKVNVEITATCRLSEEGEETRVVDRGEVLEVEEQNALQLVSSGRAILVKAKPKGSVEASKAKGDGA